MKRRILAGILCITMLFGTAACGKPEKEPQLQSENLMEELEKDDVENAGAGLTGNESTGTVGTSGNDGTSGNGSAGAALAGQMPGSEYGSPLSEFGVALFGQTVQQADAQENVLVSPLSVLLALYMTANGAGGNTAAQMKEVLGDDLNAYLKAYQEALPQGENYSLKLANGIWFREESFLTVQEKFLKINQDYFNAGLYKAPFNETTCKEINEWVKEKTDGMIDGILDEISEDAVLYLVNALSFDAKWENEYDSYSVQENATFTKEDGTKQTATLMHSEESTYLEDELATGFVKYYKDKKYAFVALLPKEGVTVAEYVAAMDATKLQQLLANAKRTTVNAALPKFEVEYDILLNDILSDLGMPDAFSASDADFSNMASSKRGNIFISQVLHKTFLSVDELGTKAGAATIVAMQDKSAPMEFYTVTLNRPFVYLLVDCETNQPFFMGTLMDAD